MQEISTDPWAGKIPWRREWQPTPLFLLGESHGQRSLAGYSPWGCKESDTTEQVCTTLEGMLNEFHLGYHLNRNLNDIRKCQANAQGQTGSSRSNSSSRALRSVCIPSLKNQGSHCTWRKMHKCETGETVVEIIKPLIVNGNLLQDSGNPNLCSITT